MDQTPTRASRSRNVEAVVDVDVLDQDHEEAQELRDHVRNGRVRKPPPVTPRRFTKFFTPRPRNPDHAVAVKTSRHALRSISTSALNARARPSLPQEVPNDYWPANENHNSRKKRKYSSITSSALATPATASIDFLPSSQDALPSSPIKYGREEEENPRPFIDDDSDATTEIDDDSWSNHENENENENENALPTGPPIIPYMRTSTSRSLLATRLTGRIRRHHADTSDLWQAETADFYTSPDDINLQLRDRQPPIIPFSMTACHTNPVIAVGDEEGIIRFLDTAEPVGRHSGFGRTVMTMQPHENAVMDLAFSADDNYVATASGDQTCQVIDVLSQRSLYSLRAHTASVKKIQFQPGSGNRILATAGRDGTICLWDTRLRGQPLGGGRRARIHVTEMANDMSVLSPVLEIFDAHSPNSKSKSGSKKSKQHSIAARNDFSITSLTFLDQTRSNLLATASEVDTVIKLWDLRQSQISARKRGHCQLPVSITNEPRSHEHHRRFGINSLALSTDSSRLYALSRDHTVYAYATSHLVLGCSPEMTPSRSLSRKSLAPARTESHTGLGPLYGLRHPSLRVATFWPRLAIRHCNNTNSELLAVGSTDDCVILFPTSEKHHSSSARVVPAHHYRDLARTSTSGQDGSRPVTTSRPSLTRRTTSSFNSLFSSNADSTKDSSLPIFYHGTPLINAHSKEVTSVAWGSDGALVTASDDFTIRCWRDGAHKCRKFKGQEARRLRGLNLRGQRDAAALMGWGWASVGVPGWDDEDDDEDDDA